MKTNIFIGMLVCLSLAGSASAQHKDGKRHADFEQFRAKRVAYITEKVKLTPEEAEAFWPLVNELQEKRYELNKPLRERRRSQDSSRTALTEADYRKIIDTSADIRLKEAQLNKEYLEKLKKVLSAEKIFRYQRAEEEFMRQMFAPKNKDRGEKDRERKNISKPEKAE
jgi:hypothetical protein